MTTETRREAGSIQEWKPGKWRIWVSGGRDELGRRIRVSEVFEGSKRDAGTRLRTLQTQIERGEYVPGHSLTVGQFVERWWPTKAASLSPTGAVGVWRLLDRYIVPSIGRRPIQKVGTVEVAALVGALVKGGRVGQADHLYQVLRLLFNAAIKASVMAKSPVEGVERPQKQHREMAIITPREWRQIREYLESKGSWAVPAFTLLLTCGLRRSELVGLRWADLDLGRRLIHVQRSYHKLKGGQAVIRAPKSSRGRRLVAFDHHTASIMTDHRQHCVEQAGMLRRSMADDDYVFARQDGTPWPPDAYSQLWRRTMAALGIKCRLHDLRHSSASLLIAAGADVKLISARLGHASTAFTMDTYGHLLPGAQEEMAERLARMLDAGSAVLPPVAAAG